MKTTILNYDKKKVDIGIPEFSNVSDYHSKKINLWDIEKTEIQNMLRFYQISNDDKIERISLELYGTPDYWDILLLLNGRDPLFDMPYNDGLLRNNAEKNIAFYQNSIFVPSPLRDGIAEVLFNEYLDDSVNENEKLRNIIVVKPSRINDFLTFIKNEGYLVTAKTKVKDDASDDSGTGVTPILEEPLGEEIPSPSNLDAIFVNELLVVNSNQIVLSHPPRNNVVFNFSTVRHIDNNDITYDIPVTVVEPGSATFDLHPDSPGQFDGKLVRVQYAYDPE